MSNELSKSYFFQVCRSDRMVRQRLLRAGLFCGLISLSIYIFSSNRVISHRSERLNLLEETTDHSRWNISDFHNKFSVITMLSLYCGHTWPGYESFNKSQLYERDREYLDVLQSNIDHPLVKEVHLFYTDDEALEVVKSRSWANMNKIIPVKSIRRLHMADFFQYASKYLLDRTIIALNGDIVIGEGFDKINTTAMRDNRVLYTLTRHGFKKGNCEVPNMCLNQKYQGSHDTHIFHLKEPISEFVLEQLNFPINMWQAENGMIGVFQYKLNFLVFNPCAILKTYHHHCSPVHKKARHNSIKDPPTRFPAEQLSKSKPVNELLYN